MIIKLIGITVLAVILPALVGDYLPYIIAFKNTANYIMFSAMLSETGVTAIYSLVAFEIFYGFYHLLFKE